MRAGERWDGIGRCWGPYNIGGVGWAGLGWSGLAWVGVGWLGLLVCWWVVLGWSVGLLVAWWETENRPFVYSQERSDPVGIHFGC